VCFTIRHGKRLGETLKLPRLSKVSGDSRSRRASRKLQHLVSVLAQKVSCTYLVKSELISLQTFFYFSRYRQPISYALNQLHSIFIYCLCVEWSVVDGQCSDAHQFQYLANGSCLPCPSRCSSCLSTADDVRYPCAVCAEGFLYVTNPRSALTAGGRCVAGCDDLGLLATSRDSSRIRLTVSDSSPVGTVLSGEGRLEVWYSGKWWSVCDDRWTMINTDVVCQEMGLGRAVSFTRAYNAANLWTALSTVKIGFDDVVCDVTDTSLFECRQAPFGFPPDCIEQQTIGVHCAGSRGNDDFCTASCPIGQFPDASNARCQSCDVTGCLVCPSEGVCTRCEQLLWLLNQTRCLQSCPSGYYGNTGTGSCHRCDSVCLTCADGVFGTKCTSCHVTLALYDGACVEECPQDRLLWNMTSAVCVKQCPDGSYQPMTSSTHRLCLPCFAPCLRCYGAADNCTTCLAANHVRLTRGNGMTSCQSGCPIGQFQGPDNRCVQCDDSLCASCYVGGQYCRTCIGQSHLLEMGRCQNSCSLGLYPNYPGRVCLPVCPRGRYRNRNGQCQACPARCLDCLSSSICVTCQPGYYLLTNQRTCVSQCGSGLVAYTSTANDDVTIRVVGGLLSVDGAVEVFAGGNVARLNF